MVAPQVKSLLSVDLELQGPPSDPEDCGFAFEAEIGPQGGKGADLCQFVVATPKHLARESGTRWGRGYLIVERFSWDEVEVSLEKLLSHCRRETWAEVARELNKELLWEFDNYQEQERP